MTQTGTTTERPAVPAPTVPPLSGFVALAKLFVLDVIEAWRTPLVRRGLVAMVLVSAGSLTPACLPVDYQTRSSEDAWLVKTFHLQWLQSGVGYFVATMVLTAGVVLLMDTWLRLRPVGRGRTAPASAWLIWALPVLAAPPLFSRDAYSYAAQGLIVLRGMDPYQSGPVVVPGPFADQIDIMWHYTPAPYGPVALQVQHFVVWATQGNAYAAAVGMRLPALVSMAIIAFALPRLADRVGVNREQAIWLGVLNPLAIMHIVGGMHNDAMMIACVVLALLLAARGHLFLGPMTLALGASFKQTAFLALIGVVALSVRARRGKVDRVPYLLGLLQGTVVSVGTFELLTVATGLGWGWIPNLSVPASIRSLLSPPTLLGSLVQGPLYLAGVSEAWQKVPVQLTQAIGLQLFVIIAVWLTWSLAPRRPVMASASMFIAFCLCGPVIHPWYMLWGIVPLASTKLDRRGFKAVIYVSLFLCTYSMIDAAFTSDRSALIVSTLALVIWSLQGVWRRGGSGAGGDAGGLLGPKPWHVAPIEHPPVERPRRTDVDGAVTSG